LKSERLYSDLIAALAFFIELPFASRHATRAEYSDGTRSVSVVYRKQAAKTGAAESEIPTLADGMIRIGTGNRKRIKKHGGGLIETDPMLSTIAFRLLLIPFEVHSLRPLNHA
jgi:hypothetical protein